MPVMSILLDGSADELYITGMTNRAAVTVNGITYLANKYGSPMTYTNRTQANKASFDIPGSWVLCPMGWARCWKVVIEPVAVPAPVAETVN